MFSDHTESAYLIKPVLELLRFDEDFSKYNSCLLVIPEEYVDDKAVMRSIGYYIKSLPVKNFLLGLSNENSKSIKNFDNIVPVLEAIPLSKTLKNFGILRLHTEEMFFT